MQSPKSERYYFHDQDFLLLLGFLKFFHIKNWDLRSKYMRKPTPHQHIWNFSKSIKLTSLHCFDTT